MGKHAANAGNVITLKDHVNRATPAPLTIPKFDNTDSIHARGNTYASYEQASKYAKMMGIKTSRDWFKFHKTNPRPKNIPSDPAIFYTNNSHWYGWADFLGNDDLRGRYQSKEALKKVKKWFIDNDVKTVTAFTRLKRQGLVPDFVPSAPNTTFKVSFKELLSPCGVEEKYFKYKKAKRIVSSWNCKDYLEFRAVRRKKIEQYPELKKIPGSPDRIYKDGDWVSWAYFLGKK